MPLVVARADLLLLADALEVLLNEVKGPCWPISRKLNF
jgi:hypothetical protein